MWYVKRGKEGGSSPALAVAPSLECGGGSMGGGGLRLYQWAKISSGPLVI